MMQLAVPWELTRIRANPDANRGDGDNGHYTDLRVYLMARQVPDRVCTSFEDQWLQSDARG